MRGQRGHCRSNDPASTLESLLRGVRLVTSGAHRKAITARAGIAVLHLAARERATTFRSANPINRRFAEEAKDPISLVN